MTLLAFRLDEARYALDVAVVQRVVRATAIAPLPQAPAIVEGVVNVAGGIVAVLDLRLRFRTATQPLHPDQHFIVATAGPRRVALRVDRAEDIIAVDRSAIEAPARAVPGAGLVAGIARLPDGLLVITDLERFLAWDEGAALDAALANRDLGAKP